MRSFSELFIVLALGLILGGAFSWYTIQNNHDIGALSIAQWTAWPLAGNPDADPYTKAKTAVDGALPLGAGEGIAFHTHKDDQGKALKPECQYTLTGQTPLAYFWTLTAANFNEAFDEKSTTRSPALSSQNIIRQSDGRFTVEIGSELAPLNWMEIYGSAPYQLILRLYNSPITTTQAIVSPQMPTLTLLRCP